MQSKQVLNACLHRGHMNGVDKRTADYEQTTARRSGIEHVFKFACAASCESDVTELSKVHLVTMHFFAL